MLNKNLKKLLDLSKRTSSPLIITGIEGEDPVVLMSIDQYEEITTSRSYETNLNEYEQYEDHIDTLEYERPVIEEEENSIKKVANHEEGEKFTQDPVLDTIIHQDSVENIGEIGSEEQFYLEPIE